MLALADSYYRFMYVDVGAEGRASDASMWERCKLGEYLENDPLPFTDQNVPRVIFGDDTFPLNRYLNLSTELRITTEYHVLALYQRMSLVFLLPNFGYFNNKHSKNHVCSSKSPFF